MSNKILQNMAKSSDPQIFAESLLQKKFQQTEQDGYIELQDTYANLFED